MKMINDMDMYYARTYTKEYRPMWMKDERIDYCEKPASRRGTFLKSLFKREAKPRFNTVPCNA